MKFVTRAYNNIVATDRGTIIKSSTNPKLKDEIDFMLNLPGEMIVYFPRIIDYNKTKTWVEMEYYPYDDLSKFIFQFDVGDIHINFIDSLKQYFKIAKQFEYKADQNSLDRLSMFKIKTEIEYGKLIRNNDLFSKISHNDVIFINGTSCRNFHKLLDHNGMEDVYTNLMSNDCFNFIHGDLCFSNILVGSNQNSYRQHIKLIDPRGSFGANKQYGDIYYDLAKLAHSIYGGYEWIINNKFKVVYDKYDPNCDRFTFNLTDNSNMNWFQKTYYDKLFKDYDMKKINIIQGLIFIGMCFRHYDSLDRQLAMYLTGIKLLNENL